MKTTKPKPTSIISFDIGRKRIGLAGCDPMGISITSLPSINRGKFIDDLKTLEFICLQRKVKGLVFGLPLDEEGMHTTQSKYCEKYGQKMGKALGLPIAWVNEHSSTWAASEQHQLHSDRTGRLDSECAALLLEQWLREGPELKPVHMASFP